MERLNQKGKATGKWRSSVFEDSLCHSDPGGNSNSSDQFLHEPPRHRIPGAEGAVGTDLDAAVAAEALVFTEAKFRVLFRYGISLHPISPGDEGLQ
jgi:hypothetical protein